MTFQIPWVSIRLIYAARHKRQAQPGAYVRVIYQDKLWIDTVAPGEKDDC